MIIRFRFKNYRSFKDEQELCSIRAEALDGMRKACGKEPKIAFTHVTDEHGAIGVHHCDAGIASEYISPFISSVPVHFAIAACNEAHLDAGNILGRRKDPLRHLMGPPTLFDAFFYQIEGIPDGYQVAVIRRRRSVGVWVLR